MTDKQIIIDYKKLCENYSKEVGCFGTFDGSCIKEQCFTYKLLQQLQAKQQECKELKKYLFQARNVATSLNTQLDQLKKTNENLLSIQYELVESNAKLGQTLTEIKEIAEKIADECQIEPYGACALEAKEQILQKISECEGNDELTK